MRRTAVLLLVLPFAAACGKEEAPVAPAPAPRAPYVVDADWLRAHRADVVVVDMQSERALYEKGHVPGAVHVEVDDLRDERKYLLPAERLAERLGALGIDADTHVVAYDEKHGRNAGWIWFALDQLGHGAVSLLDGHLDAFRDGLEAGPGPRVEPRTYRPRRAAPDLVDSTWVHARLGEVVVLDARPPEQYTGEKPKEGMQGGHVPGAINVPWDSLLDANGRYLPPEEARARLARRIDGEIWRGRPIVLYCNSYHQAAHLHFELARLGYDNLKAFDGSMKEWEARKLPLKQGAQP